MLSPPPPSDWILRWQHLLDPHCTVLDLACGAGRHLRHFAQQGHRVTGVDRNAGALAPLAHLGEVLPADLENGPWPLAQRQFAAVIVTNYLWRPRWPQLRDCLAPGGVLLYETFAHGHAAYGHPRRAEFLLQPGELLSLCAGWHIVAYEHGVLTSPGSARVVQRIAAVRPASDAADTLRPLQAE